MSLKTEKDKTKQLQDKCQSVLNALLRDEDNKYCVDCDSKGPRWASWNIGVFLCIRCAGIHRNLGVHISKVKSVNLDSWTPEQVVSLQQMGNSRARAVYEANLPDNFRRPQNDSSLESFIRAKYEHKKYIAREWVPPPLPKVNWEKEIDEEMEKQKRKKKTILERKPLANVEVPQLPKPTNPSPKPSRSVSNTPETKEKQKHASNSNDLLGINGEDSFSSFISASPAQQTTNSNPVAEQDAVKKEETISSVKSEEESFFNQTIPAEKEKVKLDKDSILALYGSAPTIPQFQNTMQVQYQAPGNFQPVLPPQQGGFQAFGGFPQSGQVAGYPVPNGLPAVQGQFLQQGSSGFQNWNKAGMVQFPQAQTQSQFIPTQFAQTNQFHNGQSVGSAQFPAAFPGQIPVAQPQFGGTVSQSTLGNTNFAQPLPSNNAAFFGNSSTLPIQQQFGNLTLNGATTTPAPNHVATNIWQ